jgi:glucose/mannose-6-phosphate isomerase
MHVLDDERRRKRIDTENVLDALTLLPAQARDAWAATQRLSVGALRGIKRIIVAGMGGSALGAHIARSVYREQLRVPLEIGNGYTLPGGVDKNTLVILSSYSGTTEETLAAAIAARRQKATMLGICTGGPLGAFLQRQKVPAYIFTPTQNPGNQPRMGLGYGLFGLLGLLRSGGLLAKKVDADVTRAITALERAVSRVGMQVSYEENSAKKMAVLLQGSAVLYVGAEHLEGSVHALTNQTNETGKQFACWFSIPELNHHLMEGLAYPKQLRKTTQAVFLSSSLYHPRVQERFALTEDVVRKNGLGTQEWRSAETTRLAQVADLLVFGGALTYYLGILHRENLSAVRWVDYFKRQLKKSREG